MMCGAADGHATRQNATGSIFLVILLVYGEAMKILCRILLINSDAGTKTVVSVSCMKSKRVAFIKCGDQCVSVG